MAVPTVVGTIAKGGTSANAASLVLTLTAGAAVGTAVFLITSGPTVATISDSKSHPWTIDTAVGQGLVAWTTVVNALAVNDTITLGNLLTNTCAALAVNISGLASTLTNAIKDTGGSSQTTASSTSAKPSTSVTPSGVDSIELFPVVIASGAVAGDFSSVDSGYTLHDSAFTSGTGTQKGASLSYKTISTAAAQQPTVTLANSRNWFCVTPYQFDGVFSRGSVGNFSRCGDKAALSSGLTAHPGGATHIPFGQIGKTGCDSFPQPPNLPHPRSPRFAPPADGLTSAE
jgi:hypothetical protein